MRVEHIGLWTTDLARAKRFYCDYLGAQAGAHYRNPAKGFESCFLRFESGARLELMTSSTLAPLAAPAGAQRMGLTHLAVSLGSPEAVDALAARLRADGRTILDGPRSTGDGYYEAVTLDADGNRIELMA